LSVGTNIRRARKHAQLSQEELARRAGMSLTGLAGLEQGGRKDPHLSTLTKLASALGITVPELLDESDSPKVVAPTSPRPDDEERRDYWIVESWDRTLSQWFWKVQENKDPKDSYVIANACLEFAKDIVRFDLPGDTLAERVPEAEVAGRLRWVQRLFELSQRAQKNYSTNPQADSSEIEALEQKGKPVLRVIKGEVA